MVRPILALCLFIATDVLAQQPGTPRPMGPLPGARVQRPPRDPRDAPTGTAVIRGRVVAADTGTPIRRAQIRAFSPEVRDSRGTSTDAQGRFELRDLPAGRWELSASKAGFVTLRYGQRRPREAGQPIELADGERMERATIALPRGAAVTGRIVDEFGDPIAGARVQAMRHQTMQGTRQLMPVGMDMTDDTGAFRLYGLTPGDYYVTGLAQGGAMFEDSSDTTGYAPTYYPGTSNLAEAQRVSVAVGQEVTNITFALLATKAVRVTGTVLDSKGERLANGFIAMQDTSQAGGMFMQRSGARIRSDGSFTISNVTPGTYTLIVNTSMGPAAAATDEPEFASVRVTVGNEDLTGINLVTNKGATVTGSVIPAPGSAGNLSMAGLMVLQQPGRSEMTMMMQARSARVEPDGTFRVTGVQGQRLFRVVNLPPSWSTKAIMLNGEDIIDKPMEFKGAEEVSGLQILVTDRVTEVTGRVTTAKGEPTRDYTVIIFPEDSLKWDYPSRYIRSGRADQDGIFKIRGLPPDEAYLAVAVDYLEDGEGGDPDFLGQIKDRATKLSITEGETKAFDLKLITR